MNNKDLIRRICEINPTFIQDISLVQYLKITKHLFKNGNINVGRVVVFLYFTYIVTTYKIGIR